MKQTKNEYNELAKEIIQFFDLDIKKRCLTKKDLFQFLQSQQLIYCCYTVCSNQSLWIENNPKIYFYCESEQGVTKIYLIGKRTEENYLKTEKEKFVRRNSDYLLYEGEKTLSRVIVDILKERKEWISFAESCTGGLLCATLINASSASEVLKESYVTYAESAKKTLLEVKQETLDQFSVYSKEVAKEMVEGLKKRTKADLCVSVTGHASSGDTQKGNGSCDYAICYHDKTRVYHLDTEGLRNEVRMYQVNTILCQVIWTLNNII